MRHILTVALATLTVSTPFLFADNDRSPFGNATTLVTISGTRPAPQVLPAFQGMPPGTIEQVIGWVFTTIVTSPQAVMVRATGKRVE